MLVCWQTGLVTPRQTQEVHLHVTSHSILLQLRLWTRCRVCIAFCALWCLCERLSVSFKQTDERLWQLCSLVWLTSTRQPNIWGFFRKQWLLPDLTLGLACVNYPCLVFFLPLLLSLSLVAICFACHVISKCDSGGIWRLIIFRVGSYDSLIFIMCISGPAPALGQEVWSVDGRGSGRVAAVVL